MSGPTSTYQLLDDKEDESTDHLLIQSEPSTGNGPFQGEYPRHRRRWARVLPWVLHLLLLSISATLFLLSLRKPSDSQCARRLSAYSSLIESVEYHDIKFNGSLFNPSVYMGKPSPELDGAWNAIVQRSKPTRITSEMLKKLHKEERPSLIRFMDVDGGGYLGSLEFTHQLHCLNVLRKHTYYDYYKDTEPAILEGPRAYRNHLDHCVDMLRQHVLCNADVGLVTYDWVKGYDTPYPDFSNWHRCRNVEKIWEWNEENSVHLPRERLTRFGDDVDLEHPDGWKPLVEDV